MADIPYWKALKIVRAAGMSVEDGLAFTVCGGQLVNGEDAPDYIKEVNGSPVDEAAAAIIEAEGRAALSEESHDRG
jgi:hypothetical protein